MLRDILKGEDPQIQAVLQVIAAAQADILILQSIDYDHDLAALQALNASLSPVFGPYPFHFALRPNTGMSTRFDLNGDGYRGDPEDAQGFGRFAGQGGMAVLSRWPIASDQVVDFSELRWLDLPEADPPRWEDGTFFPSVEAMQVQRLSTTGHWAVPINLSGERQITILTMHASPPVFDGPEDRNGRRNADELRIWQHWLDGRLSPTPPDAPFVIAGDANLDPFDSDGRHAAIRALLADSRIQDPEPLSDGGAEDAVKQGGINLGHQGDAALDTVDWPDETGRPGNLRVDYVLPSSDLDVVGSGVIWPRGASDDAADLATAVRLASRHRLVWVDVRLQGFEDRLAQRRRPEVGQ